MQTTRQLRPPTLLTATALVSNQCILFAPGEDTLPRRTGTHMKQWGSNGIPVTCLAGLKR